MRFSEAVFRLNDQTAIALATGDKIYPSSFELSYQRKLKGVYTGQYINVAGSAKQELVDEPTNDDMPDISLKLTFPRHTSTTYLTALGNDTRKKADITFTGGIIEGAIKRSFLLQLPHLQLKDNAITDQKGIIQEPLEFIVHGISTAPAGMTGITEPFRISGTNRRSTDYLA